MDSTTLALLDLLAPVPRRRYPLAPFFQNLEELMRDLPPLNPSNVSSNQTNNGFEYTFQMAGISSPEQVDVAVNQRSLEISAESPNGNHKYRYSVSLDRSADVDSADVTLEHGLLTVIFGRRESPEFRRLTVNAPTASLPSMDGNPVTVGDCSDSDE